MQDDRIRYAEIRRLDIGLFRIVLIYLLLYNLQSFALWFSLGVNSLSRYDFWVF